MPNIKHKKVSAKAAPSDATLVGGPDWNDEHTLDQYLDYPDRTAAPAAPTSGLRTFVQSRATRRLLSMVGPSGLDVALQPSLFGNAVALWRPGVGTTAAISFGTSWTVAATQAHPNISVGTFHSQTKRATFTTSTTAGNAAGVRSASPCCWRGNAAGLGGFFFVARFGFVAVPASFQFFVGLNAASGLLAGEPSAVANQVGIGKDSTDANMQLMFRDGSAATKVNLGVAPAVDAVYELCLFCAPNDTNIDARVVRLNDGTVLANDTMHNTNIPANTALLYPHAEVRTTTTTAAALSLLGIYVETDN